MRQDGSRIKSFRVLIIFVCASFVINEVICYSVFVPEMRMLCYVLSLLSKLIDLAMIYLFYMYLRETLGFEGKLAKIAKILIPVILIAQALVLLANIITLVTFTVDAAGIYQSTDISLIEDIALIVTSVLTTVMIFMSHNPFNQKAAALTFIFYRFSNTS